MSRFFKQPFRITNTSDVKCLVCIDFTSVANINDIVISFNGDKFTTGIQEQIVLSGKSYIEIIINDKLDDVRDLQTKKYFKKFTFKTLNDNELPRISLSGNINSLYTSKFSENNFIRYPNRTNALPVSAFSFLFSDNDLLESAENLILPSLTRLGYQGLFSNCHNLKLPPKTLFYFASNTNTYQTEVPSYAFQGMFKGCTSLQKIPNFIRGVYFHRNSCDQMFDGCESLTDISNFTTLIIGANEFAFRQCFARCKNLIKFPENIYLYAIKISDHFQQGAFHNMFDIGIDKYYDFWKFANNASTKIMNMFSVSDVLYQSNNLHGLLSHIFGEYTKHVVEMYGTVFYKNSKLFYG